MSDSENILEIVELARDFDGHFAVQDVSLTVGKGEILALLGPNGVGKSTLLKLIAGLLMPSHGEAKLWGVATWPPSPSMRRVACLLDGSPPPGVSVREILALKSCVNDKFDRAAATAHCERHGIDLNKSWSSLSKGQKRWVLLASILASGAEFLLLDEPADGLDVATRRELYGHLRTLANDHGVTTIVASHIIADVERIADDVVILVDGHVRLHSPLEQLRDEVCEVELRGSIADIMPFAEVISSRTTSDSQIAVVRFRSQNLAEQQLPGEISRRRLGLEDLYLAYTQPGQAGKELQTTDA